MSCQPHGIYRGVCPSFQRWDLGPNPGETKLNETGPLPSGSSLLAGDEPTVFCLSVWFCFL